MAKDVAKDEKDAKDEKTATNEAAKMNGVQLDDAELEGASGGILVSGNRRVSSGLLA